MKNLIGFTKEELLEEIKSLGESNFRANQIWSWMYYYGVDSFDKMTNLSKKFRETLKKNYSVARPKIVTDLVSKDGTRKWLLEFEDGERVEMVYIPEEDRGTLCISSQIGCAMGCKFCHTGTQKLTRNMTAGEIVQQFMIARDMIDDWKNISKGIGAGRRITNIVMMGMGEPLMNYDNVVKGLNIIMHPDGIAFSKRRITISTCGLVPQIRQLADDSGVLLAISLHATTDEIRNKIMPVNQKYDIDDLMRACQYYAKHTNRRRITFEYVLIKGVNDSEADAYRLIELVKKYKLPAKFNLIPFNEWEGSDFKAPNLGRAMRFAEIITEAQYPCPIRKPRGQDIMAACGQLKSKHSSN